MQGQGTARDYIARPVGPPRRAGATNRYGIGGEGSTAASGLIDQNRYHNDSIGVSWNAAATVRPVSSAGLECLHFSLAPGGSAQVRHLHSSGLLLFTGMEGTSQVQCGANSSTIAPGQMELRLVSAPLAIRSSLRSRGLAVFIPQHKLKLKGLRSGAGRTAAFQPHCPMRLDMEEGSLTVRLLHDCLASIANRIADGHPDVQMERAGDLILVLLREALSQPDRSTEAPVECSIPWYVASAEREISQNVTNPVSVAALAESAGVSPRTLHDGFRKHRGISPMRLLRMQRMQMVREELSNPIATTSVTDAALKWGFNHLGRFSAYYVAEFGEKPSETLRLGRSGRS